MLSLPAWCRAVVAVGGRHTASQPPHEVRPVADFLISDWEMEALYGALALLSNSIWHCAAAWTTRAARRG